MISLMGRQRGWTDDQLRDAVADSQSWRQVVRKLGLAHSASAYTSAQSHAARLGLDVRHLPAPRQARELIGPARPTPERAELAVAVRESSSWAELQRRLGYEVTGSGQGWIRRVVAESELDVSHFCGQSWASQPIAQVATPFSRNPSAANLRRSAAAIATAWFQARDYRVAIPVEPAPYDLVVESDDGLVRIQVKSTTRTDFGRWIVGVTRREYDPAASSGRRARRYSPGEIDFFFIVTGDGAKYLIPLEVSNGATTLTLDGKYAAFRVD
jgi:hypothetical protein